MDDLQLVKNELEKAALSDMPELEEKTGVPRDTLIKIKYGTTKNPRYETVKPLVDYFRAREQAA